MSASTQKPVVSKAVLALRAYLATAPQAELDARLARVQSLGIPGGSTVVDLVAQRALTLRTEALAIHSTACFPGSVAKLDVPAGEYNYAMAA